NGRRSRIGTLGFPLLEPRVGQTVLDQRMKPQFACRGQARLDLQGGAVELKGDLIDVSTHGFRVSFAHPAPATGTEMEFSHQFFRGRARVMWTRQAEGHMESNPYL